MASRRPLQNANKVLPSRDSSRWNSPASTSPDAIEAWSTNLPPRAAGRIRALAARLGVPVVADSDAHEAGPLGRYYNETDGTPAGEAELWDLIRAGRFRPRAPGLA